MNLSPQSCVLKLANDGVHVGKNSRSFAVAFVCAYVCFVKMKVLMSTKSSSFIVQFFFTILACMRFAIVCRQRKNPGIGPDFFLYIFFSRKKLFDSVFKCFCCAEFWNFDCSNFDLLTSLWISSHARCALFD